MRTVQKVVARRSPRRRDNTFFGARDGVAAKVIARHTHTGLGGHIMESNDRKLLWAGISETTLVEILKQTPDDGRRTATVAIVDELSAGIALIAEPNRIATEIAYFFHHYSTNADLHALDELVWTKVGFCFGEQYPYFDGLNQADLYQVQKSYFDFMWRQPLSKLMDGLPNTPYREQDDLDSFAARLDADIKSHQLEMASFRKTYRDEIAGAVDNAGPEILDVLGGMAEKAGHIPLSAGSTDEHECLRMAKNLVIGAFENGAATPHLRTIHAMANLHAGLRWNRRTKFEGNHLYDFSHASGAVGYCDAFFTEGLLANLINGGHVRLDRAYGCATTNRAVEVIAILRNFLENPTQDQGE